MTEADLDRYEALGRRMAVRGPVHVDRPSADWPPRYYVIAGVIAAISAPLVFEALRFVMGVL